MIVVGIDTAYGAGGRTGVDAGGALQTVPGAVSPATIWEILSSVWAAPFVPGGRVLAVEWPFIPAPFDGPEWRARAEGALQLAAAATAWATVAALLGARVLTPSAVQWRPWLVAEMRAAGLRAPAPGASRKQWKAAAVRFTGIASDHEAEARSIRGWGERHVWEGL